MGTFKKCLNIHKFCLQASNARGDKGGTSRGCILDRPWYRQQWLRAPIFSPQKLPSSNFPQIYLSCITCPLNLQYNTCNSSASYHYKLLPLTFSNLHLLKLQSNFYNSLLVVTSLLDFISFKGILNTKYIWKGHYPRKLITSKNNSYS